MHLLNGCFQNIGIVYTSSMYPYKLQYITSTPLTVIPVYIGNNVILNIDAVLHNGFQLQTRPSKTAGVYLYERGNI